MAFTFTTPVMFSKIGLMDIPNANLQSLIFTYQDGMVETFTYKGLDDNSLQCVIANKMNALKLDVFVPYSGAVVTLNFCPNC